HVFFQLQPAWSGGGFLEAGQELWDDALPFAAVLPDGAAAHPPLESDMLVAAALEQPVSMLLGKLFPRFLQIDAERVRNAFEDVPPPASHAAQGADERDRALVEAETRIRYEQIDVEGVARAQAVAIRAHSVRAVEAE